MKLNETLMSQIRTLDLKKERCESNFDIVHIQSSKTSE